MKLGQRAAIFYIRTKFKLLSAISKKKAAVHAFELFCTPPTRDKKELPDIFKRGEKLEFRFIEFDIAGFQGSALSRKRIHLPGRNRTLRILRSAIRIQILFVGRITVRHDVMTWVEAQGKEISIVNSDPSAYGQGIEHHWVIRPLERESRAFQIAGIEFASATVSVQTVGGPVDRAAAAAGASAAIAQAAATQTQG